MTKLKINRIVMVVIVTVVTVIVIVTSFSKNNLTPRQPMRCSQGTFSRLSQCFLRGGGPLVISHKCRLISWLFLVQRPPMHFIYNTFPGTSDKISHSAKFHSSSCLISWPPKSGLCETTECNLLLINIHI